MQETLAATAQAPSRRARQISGAGASGAGAILLIVVLATTYFVPRGPMWNADSRVFLTASIVDRGRLDIDPFATNTGDVAYFHGHYYSDKAPGASLFALPVYVVLKYTLLGGKPYSALFAVPESQRLDFLPRYILAFVFAGLPTGSICMLLYYLLAVQGVSRGWRTLLALTYGLGTIALPFATVFFGHQLAAACLCGAFVVLFRLRRGELAPRYALAAGALAGCAIITEYPTAIIAVLLAGYALATSAQRQRALLLLGIGALPPLALAAGYNLLAFGSPLSQGYAHLAGPSAFQVGQAQGLMGITTPHWDAIWQTSFGPYRGLLLLSPVLLLAIPGFVLLFRRSQWRPEFWLWLSSVVIYYAFTVSYFQWDGGNSVGPRHYLPVLPFLVLPIGELVRAGRPVIWRAATAALAGVSIVIMGLVTATGPLFNPVFKAPLTQWVLPSLLGAAPDPSHPGRSPAVSWTASGLLHAQLDNNWGMLLRLPGILQLAPLASAVALVALWSWWRARRLTHPSNALPTPTRIAAAAPAPSEGGIV